MGVQCTEESRLMKRKVNVMKDLNRLKYFSQERRETRHNSRKPSGLDDSYIPKLQDPSRRQAGRQKSD